MLNPSVVARRLSDETGHEIKPRYISDLYYSRKLDEKEAPIVCGRRMIPESHLPLIMVELRKSGRLPKELCSA